MKYYKSANEAWAQTMLQIGRKGKEVSPRNLSVKEIQNYSLCITNPQDRIIHNPFRRMSLPYAFGEICWYLRGENSLATMQYYSSIMQNFSDDGETLNSAYGYRIFGHHPQIGFDQWEDVVDKLSKDPDSRQAIIHLHTPSNEVTKDQVCTLSLQFMIREGKLDLVVNMRSNDIVWGFTYDVFAFTFMQELMANELGIKMGKYYHNVASMHLYEKDFNMLDLLERYEAYLHYSERYAPTSFDLGGITLDEFRETFVYVEERLRLYGAEKLKDISLKNPALNLMFKILSAFARYKASGDRDLKLETLDYSNLYHVMFVNQLCKIAPKNCNTGQIPPFTIYEGVDGTGKTTLANKIYNGLTDEQKEQTILVHFKAPNNFNKYLYFYYSLMPVQIMFDRFWISEPIYCEVSNRKSVLLKIDTHVLTKIMCERNAHAEIFTLDEEQIPCILQRTYERDGEAEDAEIVEKINKLYREVCEQNPEIFQEKPVKL